MFVMQVFAGQDMAAVLFFMPCRGKQPHSEAQAAATDALVICLVLRMFPSTAERSFAR